MQHLDHLLLVYTAYIIAVASPGPSNMAIMGVAMSQGRKPALMLALGVVTGSFSWAALAATGISAVLATYAQALFVIKIAGGVYLLYLAFKSARSAMSHQPFRVMAAEEGRRPDYRALYRRGLFLHIANPKAVLGWIAIMSIGLRPGADASTLTAILIGCGILGVTIFCGYALLFSTAPAIRIYQRSRRYIEGALAMFFGFAGIRLLLSRT
ncbi:LysE family translocator [Agrobacterium tumefaciens]|uniref:LysE family translocator n=1 Tax=Agrobacterium tumefaciens TaxID=358 RepID=UPI00287EAF35|nr:LysE family translocator [Agrobacterium tumefaciens]MDS7597691.1 LysE family translocator [Agrobacterium tumefaciens]